MIKKETTVPDPYVPSTAFKPPVLPTEPVIMPSHVEKDTKAKSEKKNPSYK